jgi:hypothetical protein
MGQQRETYPLDRVEFTLEVEGIQLEPILGGARVCLMFLADGTVRWDRDFGVQS